MSSVKTNLTEIPFEFPNEMSSGNKKNLLLLFERPQEPVFVPKGTNNSTFDIPHSYLSERYKPIGIEIFNRFGEESNEIIPVKPITLPPLGEILDLDRQENFSLFIPKHRKLAGRLIELFMGMRTLQDLQSFALFSRDRINPYLFNYAFSVALLHRKDTQDLEIPSFVQSFPDKFIDSRVLSRAREEATLVPSGSRQPIEIPRDYTASDLEEEHRLAYFREDLGVNLHHWHWHLVYPFEAPTYIVDKPRRGELFFYMHQQIIARYNFERLCNKMKRVIRYNEWEKPIDEAYFSKLDSLVASRIWPGRAAKQTIQNLNRETDEIKMDISEMVRWRERTFAAIHSGFMIDQEGNRVPLTEAEGMELLANSIESNTLAINRLYYGDIHNMLHIALAYINDPDQRHLESFGVIGDTATAMRDPLFYRLHGFVDDLFQEFKETLPRYSVNQLNYPGVIVTRVEVSMRNGHPNVINTFWQQSDVDLSRGMDFQPRGSVFARFTHLQHQPFTYNITVNNQGAQRMGTCRIFMAPKFDERGNPWLFKDQKLLFIELDRFAVNLRQGLNTIIRNSNQSSVTIPFERIYRNLDNATTAGDTSTPFNFCGCGWPANLLLPRGSAEGFAAQLFVMISNYADDVVNQSIDGSCNDAYSYCGIRDKLYPDRRSMGYPFDRMPRNGVDYLQQFLTPNMRVQDCTIRFNDRIVRPNSRT